MRHLIAILASTLLVWQSAACSRSTGAEAPVLLSANGASSEELEEEKEAVLATQKKYSSDADALQKKIIQLEEEISRNQQMSSSQKLAVEQELAALRQQKAEVDQTLKTQAEKQAKLEEELRKSKNSQSVATTSTNVNSGFPLCGATYYGVTFQCGQKTCAKSDPNYQNICELTASSRPASSSSTNTSSNLGASGYPLCGAVYYGSEFNCNGRRCGKSDANFVNICEISANSRPATSTASSVGISGYPYCPATSYGSVFDCNGRRCAKSDPSYQNICELR